MTDSVKHMSEDISAKWLRRFGYASLLNAFIFLLMSGAALISEWNVAKTIAGGSAGMWYTMGYLLLGIAGIPGIFLGGVSYYLFPKISGGTVYNDKLAWIHLVFMEIGTLATTLLLSWSGINAAALERAKAGTAHPYFLQFQNPIAIVLAIAGLGALVGIINLTATLSRKK